MKFNTQTLITIAGAVGGGILAAKYSTKKNMALMTSAGVAAGVIAGQMVGDKVAAAKSESNINNALANVTRG